MAKQINDPQIRSVLPLQRDGGDESGALVGLASDGTALEGDPTDVEELPDGSAKVVFGDEDDVGKPRGASDDAEFLVNLADGIIPDNVLSQLATDLLDDFDRDREARKPRDVQYADGIKRTGLGNDAPGGADFEGASRAVHPVLIEGCIEFSARSMKELFPPNGPVKTAIIGEQTDAKVEKAERKKEYMNWQLTKQIREYRAELEQTLTQVPLGGSQYLKVWYDERIERPRVEFVPVDEMLLPFAAADFDGASRKTHVQHLTKKIFESRVASGLYREIPLGAGSSATLPEQTDSAKASDKVEGRVEDAYNDDGLRTVYECYCELELEDDEESGGQQRGYIVTVDESSRSIVGMYRNWDDDSEQLAPEALPWIVEFGFVPWRGAYKIGLAHIIGGLSGALTGALRSILDGGFLSSHAGGLMLAGSRQTGKNISGNPTEFQQISAPPNVDDIRKVAMPYPFPGPSEVIFKLMDWLTSQAKGVVSTASEAIKDAGSDTPVGTALALIEQGSITFSAVHARLHNSQRRVLEILHRINGQWLDDKVTVEELGELVVSRADFQGPMDVMPVSDPNIFSDAQRYAQNQAAMAMAEKFPQVFKIDKLVSRAMKLMNYPSYEEVLSAPAAPKKLDAISENTQASEPETQLRAYREQDHLAHIKAHVHFMASPMFCANPMMAMPALPKLLAHVKEHLLALYTQHTRAASSVTLAVQKAGGPLQGDPTVTGMAFADQELAKALGEVMPLLEQAEKMAQQFAPKPPMDPRAQTTLAVTQEKIQADASENDKDRQLDLQKTQLEMQVRTQENQVDAQNNQQEMVVATQNADKAAQSEDDDRRLQLVIEHLRQDNERVLSAHNDQMMIMLADIKAGRDADQTALQNQFQVFQQQADLQFNHMQFLLTQNNASASDAADREMERERLGHEKEMARIEAQNRQTKPGYAEGGLVTVDNPPKPKGQWVARRHPNGDLDRLEYIESNNGDSAL